MSNKIECLKIPPHSLEAEHCVLGGLMLDNEAWDKVADKVEASNFYKREHKLIFDAIANLILDKKPADVITVSELLRNSEQLEGVGGEVYIFHLLKETPTATNICAYADIVRECYVRRQIISFSNNCADSAFFPEDKHTSVLLHEAERRISQISEHGNCDIPNFSDGLMELMEKIQDRKNHQGETIGLSTGFIDLDKKTNGLHAGDLIILAGRPGIGKTVLAMNIAEHVAFQQHKSVCIFSLEMGRDQIRERMVVSQSKIAARKLKSGELTFDDYQKLSKIMQSTITSKMFIDQQAAVATLDVRTRSKKIKREHGLDLIVIDYLTLMSGEGENQNIRLSRITRELKIIARDLNVPIILISQLNREVEKRPDKRPFMSDLRDSGSIEQDADAVWLIYREDYYAKPGERKSGIAELNIAKQRNEEIGTVLLTFNGHINRFDNYIGDQSAYGVVAMPKTTWKNKSYSFGD